MIPIKIDPELEALLNEGLDGSDFREDETTNFPEPTKAEKDLLTVITGPEEHDVPENAEATELFWASPHVKENPEGFNDYKDISTSFTLYEDFNRIYLVIDGCIDSPFCVYSEEFQNKIAEIYIK